MKVTDHSGSAAEVLLVIVYVPSYPVPQSWVLVNVAVTPEAADAGGVVASNRPRGVAAAAASARNRLVMRFIVTPDR